MKIMRWKSWDIPNGFATVIAAIISMLGILLIFYLRKDDGPPEPSVVTAIQKDTLDADMRIILKEGLGRLKARRLMLFKMNKPIRQVHAVADMEGNTVTMVSSVDIFGALPPPSEYLPHPVNIMDIFDLKDLDKTIFNDFWEFPDRASAAGNKYILSTMENNGMMALLSCFLKDNNGLMVGIMSVQYDEKHTFTDDDRNMAKYIIRKLQAILPWFNGH